MFVRTKPSGRYQYLQIVEGRRYIVCLNPEDAEREAIIESLCDRS